MRTPGEHSAIARNRHPQRRAFTLIELVATMAVMTLLMVGMGSAILIATNALPDASSPLETSRASRTIADQITGDLLCVTAVTKMAPNTITFIVPDRNHGDPGPETITYAWSGTPGDPLTYQYNAGSPATLIEDVRDFTLTYNLDTAEQTLPPVQGSEVLFFWQDATNSGSQTMVFLVTSSERCAEYFLPALPVDAVSWRITRVAFVADSKKPISGDLVVQVAPDDGLGLSPGSPIDSVSVPESSLVGGTWNVVQFANAGGLSPANGAWIAFSGTATSAVAKVNLGADSTGTPMTYYAEDLGGGYVTDKSKDLWLWVHGTVTAPDPNSPPKQIWLRSVRVSLRAGDDPSTGHQREIQILNTPEVTGL
jgi:prepilin-type N-terminal cleavage/methylation domain-containing protein